MVNKIALIPIMALSIIFLIPLVSATTYDYQIYTDGVTYYANDGGTNATVYSGTNATTVINSAVASLTGGSIYVNPGTYDITGRITLNKNNLIFRGSGEDAIFSKTGNDICILDTGAVTNVTLEYLKFVGPGVLLPTAYGMIQASYTTYLTVQHCNITGAGFHSIFLIESDNATITQNEITNSALDAIALAQGSDYCTVSYNNVSYTSDMSNYNNIDLNGGVAPCTHNLVINNILSWAHGGICFDQANYNTAQGNIISHVVLGIDLSGAGGTKYTLGNLITNNTISYNEGTDDSEGIRMPFKADSNTITNNTIAYFTDGRCVHAGGTSDIINNNTFEFSVLGVEFFQSGNTLTNNLFLNVTTAIELNGKTETISGNTYANVTGGSIILAPVGSSVKTSGSSAASIAPILVIFVVVMWIRSNSKGPININR